MNNKKTVDAGTIQRLHDIVDSLASPSVVDAEMVRRLHAVAKEITSLADSLGQHERVDFDEVWRLEQRKGRIQRIGQVADSISIYNMRYKGSVEDVVHNRLSARLKEIHDIFGQLPEVLEDVWILMAKKEEQEALERIDAVARRSPFQIKYEDGLQPCGDWGKCATVLSRRDKRLELVKKW